MSYQQCGSGILRPAGCGLLSLSGTCALRLPNEEPHSNHMTSSKRADILICHTTMRRNPINFLYNPGYVTLWDVEVGPVANAREGSTQEHDWARVMNSKTTWSSGLHTQTQFHQANAILLLALSWLYWSNKGNWFRNIWNDNFK